MAERPALRVKSYDVFAVFSPGGRLETARPNRKEAEDAAAIIGGTDWASRGFTVEPVQLTRYHGRG